MKRSMTALAAAPILLILAACGHGDAHNDVRPATPLLAALGRIAASDDTSVNIVYDNTAALVRLTGKDPAPSANKDSSGFSGLRARGADLDGYATILPDKPGLVAMDADYTISAGRPPGQVAMVAGGQNADKLGRGLADLGWKTDQDRLIAPGLDHLSEDTAPLALRLAQVRISGSDVLYGGSKADLGRIGKPSGPTLADDPRIKALADCLGDVAAAAFDTPKTSGKLHPTGLAAGVRMPSKDSDIPHVIVCASWAGDGEANQYRTVLGSAFNDLTSASAVPWRDSFPSVSVHDIGGDQHVVSWESDTPKAKADLFLRMFLNLDLPAFPPCGRMPPAAKAKLSDYC